MTFLLLLAPLLVWLLWYQNRVDNTGDEMCEEEAQEIILRFWKHYVSPRYVKYYRIHVHGPKNSSEVVLPLWLSFSNATFGDLYALITKNFISDKSSMLSRKSPRYLDLSNATMIIPKPYTVNNQTLFYNRQYPNSDMLLSNHLKQSQNTINIYIEHMAPSQVCTFYPLVYSLPLVPGIFKIDEDYSISSLVFKRNRTANIIKKAALLIEKTYRNSVLYKTKYMPYYVQRAYKNTYGSRSLSIYGKRGVVDYNLFKYAENVEDFDHINSVLKLHHQTSSCVLWRLFTKKRYNFPLVYGFCEYNEDMECIGSTVHMFWAAMYSNSSVKLVKNFFVRRVVSIGDVISLVDFMNIWDNEIAYSLSSRWLSSKPSHVIVYGNTRKSFIRRSDVVTADISLWNENNTYKSVIKSSVLSSTYPIVFKSSTLVSELWCYFHNKYSLNCKENEMKISYRNGKSSSMWAFRPHFINYSSNMEIMLKDVFKNVKNLEINVTFRELPSIRRDVINEMVFLSTPSKFVSQWKMLLWQVSNTNAQKGIMESMEENNWKFAYAAGERMDLVAYKSVRGNYDMFPTMVTTSPLGINSTIYSSKSKGQVLLHYVGIVHALQWGGAVRAWTPSMTPSLSPLIKEILSKAVDEVTSTHCERQEAAGILQTNVRRILSKKPFVFLRKYVREWRSASKESQTRDSICVHSLTWRKERNLMKDVFIDFKDAVTLDL
jgi:hypothetical protein